MQTARPVRSLLLLVLALAVATSAQAQDRMGPAARAVARAEREARRTPALHTTLPHEVRTTAVARDGRHMLGRVEQPRYDGAPSANANGRLGRVVRGVRQRLRTFRNGNGVLRTRLSRRAAERHPALATALRAFPDAVVVGRTGTSQRGYVLHGPVVRGASGRREFLRVDVARSGRTRVRIVDAETGREATDAREALASRDWSMHPAIVEVDRTPDRVFAVSDVHGSVETFASLLAQWGVVSDGATDAPTWTAGGATLVVVGDVINKTRGGSLPTIDYLRGLENAASRAGGRVIVTMGNHEGEFLADPQGRRAARDTGIDPELTQAGYRPADVARGRDAHGRGQWLRDRPIAARIGRLLFVHSGDTNRRSLANIAATTEIAIDQHDYADPILDSDGDTRDAILSSNGWESRPRVEQNHALARDEGIDGTVYGHNTLALGRETEGGLATAYGGRLTSIDSAMRESGPRAAMLRVSTRDGHMRAEALHADGTSRVLWDRESR